MPGASLWTACDGKGPVRLNLPKDYAPFAKGGFGTPSGKCELFSSRMAAQGLDPLPNYTPPHEDPQTRPDLAARVSAADGQPAGAVVSQLDVRQHRGPAQNGRRADARDSPRDAAARGINDGQLVRVFNDRGSFQARAIVADTVKPGVVVTQGIWWNKYTSDGVNCNTTTSTKLTDLGAGGTFFDNLVEVERL